jgi:hypothetical protein
MLRGFSRELVRILLGRFAAAGRKEPYRQNRVTTGGPIRFVVAKSSNEIPEAFTNPTSFGVYSEEPLYHSQEPILDNDND